MKILHTGDWHIGKLVHGHYMTEDQRYLLKQLVDLAKETSVDVIIIAGDVYDRSIPPTEAVELLDEIISELVMDLKIKVLVIAGNHDSPDRLNFASKILRDHGLYIAGPLSPFITPIVIEDDYGPVNFYMIPYAEPSVVKAIYEDDQCKNHNEAMHKIISTIQKTWSLESRNVCIAHGFVMGTETLETSDSERPLAIGGSEYIDVDCFKSFDYVALGHLHRPQKVSSETIRYSGSLLKYSFSEVKQKKSVTLIDLNEKGHIKIEQKSLRPLRDMRLIKGPIDELLKEENYKTGPVEDYIGAILTDEGHIFEPMKKLRSVYPNALQLERESRDLNQQDHKHSLVDLKEKNPETLFKDFYTEVTGEVLTDEQMAYFDLVYKELMTEERGK
jgi:exonuclease SbcD